MERKDASEMIDRICAEEEVEIYIKRQRNNKGVEPEGDL